MLNATNDYGFSVQPTSRYIWQVKRQKQKQVGLETDNETQKKGNAWCCVMPYYHFQDTRDCKFQFVSHDYIHSQATYI